MFEYAANPYTAGCPSRQLLDRIGDKWSVLIIILLDDGPMRFTQLARRIEGISQKMLTQSLRALERDGLVTRTIYAAVPPRVDYELAELGRTLTPLLAALNEWSREHMDDVAAAREGYDQRSATA